ncbi:MAG: hypothetical protein CMB31_06570 [Euryarchaeota archaeon]|nr:hypothetical protein [Euryarchaeota archaeon]
MIRIIKIIFFISCTLLGQTSDQIDQAKKLIKQTGMSESDVRSAAKLRGYSENQIDKVIQKEKNKKTNAKKDEIPATEKTGLIKPDISNNLNKKESTELPIISENEIKNPVEDLNEDNLVDDLNIESEGQPDKVPLTHFGYDIFEKDPALFQSSSFGAVDPDYLISPGDEIIVMLWGETQFRQVLVVDREGFVFIPEVGQVFVNGLNLNLLESKLFRVMSQVYASLNPQNLKATTFLDVSLGNLRPLRIQVLGEIAQPGAYTVSPAATLFSSLYYFNGPTTLGSLRDIRLIRGGKEIAKIDFYDFLLTGKKPKDQKLQLDDIIFIPYRMKTISLEGEVNRPGIYELKEDEDLSDLIEIAGGLKITAYLDRAQIDRIVPFEQRDEMGMDRLLTDVNLSNILSSEEKIDILNGDKIQVFSVLEMRQNVVNLNGAITRPGVYDLGDSLNLKQLIEKADGLLGDAYLERVDIVRTKGDFTESLIRLNLEKALEEDSYHNIQLKSLDRIIVYSISDMISEEQVYISGHVKSPGYYRLQENMTLFDLIFKSGGFLDPVFKNQAYLKRAELIRQNTNGVAKRIIPFNLGLVLDKKDSSGMLLKNNDFVRIYSLVEIEGSTKYVSITGHVKRPGNYELFENNMTIYDLIFKAGGIDDALFKENTFMDRADLIRYDDNQITKKIIPIDLQNIVKDKNFEQNVVLKPNDLIHIYSRDIFTTNHTVSIDGAVTKKGVYEFKNGMTVKDLILEAGGITDNVYHYVVEIARVDPKKLDENTFAEIIKIDMDKDFSIDNYKYNIDKSSGNIDITREEMKLMPYDYVSIRPDPYFNIQKKVSINGSIYFPGDYAILSPYETIFDIIERAGGLLPQAYPIASSFTRKGQSVKIDIDRVIKKPKSTENIFIQDNDSIFIAKKPNVIQVIGEVSSPGFYKFSRGLRVDKAIKRAGGFSPDALESDVFIIYPNGISKDCSGWLRNPKVLDGSIITVGVKPEEEPFDRTEYFKELTSIFANLAQVISIIILANR